MAVEKGRARGVASVYRLYAADGALLYVGSSINLPARVLSHSLNKPWWADVTQIKIAHFDSHGTALAEEYEAIQMERPRWNIRAARDEIKRKQLAYLKDQKAVTYRVYLSCGNCGERNPYDLPVGTATEHALCNNCGLGGLER